MTRDNNARPSCSAPTLDVRLQNLGAFARGSNFLMYPFQASTGRVYIGTYGPRPAKFYEIDPETGEYTTHAPGDYQLRMIAETSDGHLWTVSNYESMFYEFSPREGVFVGQYQCPVPGDQMVCIADSQDRLYTVKNRQLYRFDTRDKEFEDLGVAMPDWPVFNRGQHGQFGRDGKLYLVTDVGAVVFDPETGELRQVMVQDAIDASTYILLGNLHAGSLQLPWLHGYAWVTEGTTDPWEDGIHFSHHKLFRCNVETGAVETFPMERGELGQCGWFYDPGEQLHYFGIPQKGALVLNGLDWERREVVRRITLPYGDQVGMVGQSLKPRHLLLAISWLGVLVELNLDTGEHRKLFENPQPAEVRSLAACQQSYKVRFFTATSLVTQLIERREDRDLERLQRQLERMDLVILDELGYVPFSKAGAELLFDTTGRAYERTSLMVTTNLPFEEWVEIMGSERLTGALLDRLTHRVHIIEANGPSYRLQESKRRQRRQRHRPKKGNTAKGG